MARRFWKKGLISQKQLDRAIEAKSRTNLRFGEVLVLLGFVDEDQITHCLAEQYDLPIADLSTVEPTAEALGILPCSFALSRLFLPVALTAETLSAVVADPIDIEITDLVIQTTRRKLDLSLAPPSQLSEMIARCYLVPESRRAAQQPVDAVHPRHRRIRFDSQIDRKELLETLAAATAQSLKLIS